MNMLEKCNDFLKEHIKDFYNDDYRLGYHLMSPYGWMNDPHNPVVYKGKYHIFFNLHPYEPEGFRDKYWGHAVSDDMVNFTYLPCAIVSDSELDKNCCASGCVVVKDKKLHLVYTARNLDRKPRELQAIAVSEDGIHFTKPECNPILSTDAVIGENFRDPRVWEENRVYYMLLGNTLGEHGRVLLYSSNDLYNWKDEGIFCESNGSQGFMWECPDFIRLDGRDILILSPEGMDNTKHKTIYLTGELEKSTKKFIQSGCFDLDNGPDFYAPQTYDSKDGKKMLIAWMDKWFAEMPSKKKGWAGSVTIPRLLNVNDKGLLEMQPAEELKALREDGFNRSGLHVPEGYNILSGQRAVKFELRFKIDLTQTTAKTVELGLRGSEDKEQYTNISIDIEHGIVTFDKTHSGETAGMKHDVKLKYMDDSMLDVIVFVDTTSVELLINSGTTSITHRVYPNKSSDMMSLMAVGGAMNLESLEYYKLKSNTVGFGYDL